MKRFLYAKPGSGAQGPVDEADLRRLLAEATVTSQTLVAAEGTEAWVPLGQALDLSSPPAAAPPVTKLALVGNWGAVLLSLAILGAACIIAYRPSARDDVTPFKRSVEEKRAKIAAAIKERGSEMTDYKFDIRRTSSEITPYEAEMTFHYFDESEGDYEVQATFRCREGAWRTESIYFFKLSAKEGVKNAQVPVNLIYDPIGRDQDTKIVAGIPKKK